jgi:hypothetical protein
MYVDDVLLLACCPTREDVSAGLTEGHTECANWFTSAGLSMEPVKTELIFIRRCREKVDPPGALTHCSEASTQG